MPAPTIAASSESSSNVFTKPTGLADGDLLEILYWQFHGADGDPAPPSGFTSVGVTTINMGGTRLSAMICRKVIVTASGEAANYTVTQGGGSNFADGGEIFRIAGANTSSPENNAGTRTNSGTGTSATSASITTDVANCLLLLLVATNGQDPGTPSGMTSQFFQDTDVEGFSQALSATLSGATRVSTISSAEWVTVVVAIPEAGGGGGGSTQPPRAMHQYRMRRVA